LEKGINFKVSKEFYKKVKVKVALEGITLKDYIIELIEKDLKEK
jgi:predicted DNA binding CopG/RHH family protein